MKLSEALGRSSKLWLVSSLGSP